MNIVKLINEFAATLTTESEKVESRLARLEKDTSSLKPDDGELKTDVNSIQSDIRRLEINIQQGFNRLTTHFILIVLAMTGMIFSIMLFFKA